MATIIEDEDRVPPNSSNEDVKAMLQTNYGLTITFLKPLNGYEDRNYHAKVSKEHSNCHIDQTYPHGYLVKIVNAVDSRSMELNMGQKYLMDHLNSDGVKCQEQVKSLDGKYLSKISLEKDGKRTTHLVAVRTYIPGEVLANVTLSSSLAYQVGVLSAQIDRSLQSFEFPFYKTHSIMWSLDRVLEVKKVLHAVKDETRRSVANQVISAFETFVLPRKEGFQKGQIHGDINEQNILVEKTPSGFQICGLLDFQDTHYACFVYDLALAIAYMMMHQQCDLPLEDIGGHILAGYQSVFPLNAPERESLKILVASRMVQSLVYGAYNYMMDPSNEYLLTTSKVGWANLLKFWQYSDDDLFDKWNAIIKAYN